MQLYKEKMVNQSMAEVQTSADLRSGASILDTGRLNYIIYPVPRPTLLIFTHIKDRSLSYKEFYI